jgi:hypothetical protein
MEEKVNDNGFTDDEHDINNLLIDAVNKYSKLEEQHPDELSDFVFHVHAIQGILGTRILRRTYPKGWPTHKKKD